MLDNTYGQPLAVVILILSEQSVQGVVTGNDKAGKVSQKLTTEIEDDHEKVERGNTDDGIGLGNTSRSLEVVERSVLRQLQKVNFG